MGSTGIDLSIQIETREQHPGRSLVNTAITGIGRFLGLGLREVRLDIIDEFVLNPIIDLLTVVDLRCSHLLSEGNATESVHKQIVVQGTEETNLSRHCCVVISSHRQILVAVSYSCSQTGKVTSQHRVRSIIGIEARLLNTIVAPAVDSLIGRQLVGVPHLAHIARRTTIDTIDVAVAIGTAITSHGNRCIALVEQTFDA